MNIDLQAAPGAAASTAAPDDTANTNTKGLANPNDANGPTSDDAPPDPKVEQERALKRMERRIGNVTRSRYEAEARAQQAIERAERAEAQLQERQRQQQPNDGTQTQDTQRQQGVDPKEVQRLIQQEATRMSEAKSFGDRVNRVLETGRAIEGFDALTNAVNDEMPFADHQGRPTAFLRAVMDSDKPQELIAHLGKNSDLLEELQGLSEGQLIRRLDRIEQSMKQEARPSKAPKPLTPPSGSGGSSNTPSPDSPDYMAWKLKKLKGG